MKVISPLELPDLDLSGVSDNRRVSALNGMTLLWADRESFGPYLKAQRKTAGLSLRSAANKLGISHTLLARMESGDRVGPPQLSMLDDLADIYRCDNRKMLHEAGYRLEVPDDTPMDPAGQLEAQFRALILHPKLRPPLLRDEALEYIPPFIQRHWVDFARSLSEQPKPRTLVDDILDTADAAFLKSQRGSNKS